MKKLKTNDAISEEIQCVCLVPNCNRSLIITKQPKKKIKLRITNNKEITSIIILKKELMKQIKKLK